MVSLGKDTIALSSKVCVDNAKERENRNSKANFAMDKITFRKLLNVSSASLFLRNDCARIKISRKIHMENKPNLRHAKNKYTPCKFRNMEQPLKWPDAIK